MYRNKGQCKINYLLFLNICTLIPINSTEKQYSMTEIGLYLAKKSVNKSEISRRTGISKSRLSELSLNPSAKLRVDELYLIALAIDIDAGEMIHHLCKSLKLKS